MATVLTQEFVKSIFDYVDGKLFHKNGDSAEFVRHKYLAVRINGVKYYSHRIIWLYHYGAIPKYLDHKDGDLSNNRIENLREATMSQNIANANFGYGRGVEAHGKKFRARIWVSNVRIELGSYLDIEDAIIAYEQAAIKHFGEFAFCNREQ